PYKDTSLSLLLEATRRDYDLFYFEMNELFVRDAIAYGRARKLQACGDNDDWYRLGETRTMQLADLDCIIKRKDPPFDMEFVYATYILERAEDTSTLVVNQCAALRDVNEKMAITRFAHLCAPTLVTRDMAALRAFIHEQKDTVIKPLDGMGGSRVFRVGAGDGNTSVVLEVLTEHGTRYAMAQAYVPAIRAGDKRILLVDGEPVEYALARIPADGELRGNLAAGG